MRKKIFAVFILGLLLSSSGQSLYAQTQEEELVGLLQRLVLLTAKLYDDGYTIVHIEVDKLYRGQSYTDRRELFSSNYYRIIGMGGVGVKDLDLSIHDMYGNLITKDELTDNIPQLDVRINQTSNFTIKTSLYALEASYANTEYFFCYLIAFKRN